MIFSPIVIVFLPPILCVLLGLLILVLPKKQALKWSFISAKIVIGLSFMITLLSYYDGSNSDLKLWGGIILNVPYHNIIHALIFLCTGVSISFFRYVYVKNNRPDIIAIYMFATCSAWLLVSSGNFIVMFLAIETLSLCLYVLVGIHNDRAKSISAALKYFLMGSFAAAFLLMGISMIYGAVGTTMLSNLSYPSSEIILMRVGITLLLIGFMFKIAIAPFHLWISDVYNDAPVSSVSFFVSVAKIAPIVFLVNLFIEIDMRSVGSQLTLAIAVIAILSMVVGSTMGLFQTSLKRLLAFSSVAHGGYMLVGFTSGTDVGIYAVLYYIIVYALANLGIFGCILLYENRYHQEVIFDKKVSIGGMPFPLFIIILMCIFLASMAGLPPFAGFFAKYQIFVSAIQSGYSYLAIIGVIASLISAYYYFNVMYSVSKSMDQPIYESPRISGKLYNLLCFMLFILAFLITFLGIFPHFIMDNLISL